MCEFFVKADPILYEQRTRTIRIHSVLTPDQRRGLDAIAKRHEADRNRTAK